MPRIEVTHSYIIERVRDPALFMAKGMRRRGRPSKFKTVHSRTRSHLITVGRLKSTGKIKAQRILHPRREMRGPSKKFVCHDKTCKRLR